MAKTALMPKEEALEISQGLGQLLGGTWRVML
jgi:hypothetical protein